MNDFANIPLELCTYAIKEHSVTKVKLYVYLKTITPGHIKLQSDIVKKSCLDLQFKSAKTFYTNFNWLVDQGWITRFNNSDNYHVNNYAHLHKLLKFKSAWGAIYEPLDFINFKGFLAAVIITNYMRRKRGSDKRKERSKGRSDYKRIPTSVSYNLPVKYLAKALGMPPSSVFELYKLASQSDWLIIERTYTNLNLPLNQKEFIKEYSDLETHKIVVKNYSLCLQNPYIITSFIHLRRKRELRNFLSKLEKS